MVQTVGPLVIAMVVLGGGTALAADAPGEPSLAGWQASIASVPLPGEGCFSAAFPALRWQATQCTVAPSWPMAPPSAQPFAPTTVGDGVDYSAMVAGPITSATGSFAIVSPNITEKGQVNHAGPERPNTFTLQLNTEDFITPTCSGSSDPSKCRGWQQFIYETDSNSVYMQYWLLGYNATCPSGWWTYQGDCYTNSPASKYPAGAITAPELVSTALTGSATPGGKDSVVLTNGSGRATASNSDSKVDLSQSWNTAEFAVLGDAGDGEAYFGAKTTLEARTVVHSKSAAAPRCVKKGFTGETNNLNLANTPAIGTQASPTIVSEQSNGTVTPPSCAKAGGSGTGVVTSTSPARGT